MSVVTAVQHHQADTTTPDSDKWVRRRWLAVVRHALRGERGRAALAEHGPAERTALVFGRAIAPYADHSTGANVFASYETIGGDMAELLRRAGVKTGAARTTVAACFRAFQDLGLVRLEQRAHGYGGKGKPNVWTLVHPQEIPTRIDAYLPRRGRACLKAHVSPLVTKSAEGAPATKKAAKKAKPRPFLPVPLSAWRFVDELLQLDWVLKSAYRPELDRERGRALPAGVKARHLGELARAAHRLLDTETWSPKQLVALFDQENRARGWTSWTRAENPIAYFTARVKRLAAIVGGLDDPQRCLRQLGAWSTTAREDRLHALAHARSAAEERRARELDEARRARQAEKEADEAARVAAIAPATAEGIAAAKELWRKRPRNTRLTAGTTLERQAS